MTITLKFFILIIVLLPFIFFISNLDLNSENNKAFLGFSQVLITLIITKIVTFKRIGELKIIKCVNEKGVTEVYVYSRSNKTKYRVRKIKINDEPFFINNDWKVIENVDILKLPHDYNQVVSIEIILEYLYGKKNKNYRYNNVY